MIEKLSFTVTFPPTDHYPNGRSFDRDLTFNTGTINIVGPNESGKSFILEMVEFLLFGSKALRGVADDYKHLRVKGTVVIRGVRYMIERTTRNAALQQDEGLSSAVQARLASTMAVGTKPVNNRILSLLGYGLDVFRVANVVNQNDANRLSEMAPTARRAMVDKLIGADKIEALAKWASEQARGVGRELRGVESGGMDEPEMPVKPEGYEPPDVLAARLADLRKAVVDASGLRAFLANPPVAPVEPTKPAHKHRLGDLQEAERLLMEPTYNFDLEEAKLQTQRWDRWQARCVFVERYFPQPNLTRAEAEEQIERIGLMGDLARLKKSPTLTCPCGKPFTTADAEIERIEAELAKIPILKGVYDLAEERSAAIRWEDPLIKSQWEALKDVPAASRPENDPKDAEGRVYEPDLRRLLGDYGLASATLSDVRLWMKQTHAYEAQKAAEGDQLARIFEWKVRAEVVRRGLAELEAKLEGGILAKTQTLHDDARLYAARLNDYDRAMDGWTERRKRATELAAEEASWREGADALNQLRADAKSYIVPALARVASHMLAEMTGGKRSRISVDEDFEIEVDGQALNTLSGSGKVCANLAVRLGLGRILTNGVFPVFMGDEMDASMDEDRAEFLQAAFDGLKDKLSQILIITHNSPTCSQVIRLED